MRRVDCTLCLENKRSLYDDGFRFVVATLNHNRIVGAYFTYSQALRAMKRRAKSRPAQYAAFELYAWEA